MSNEMDLPDNFYDDEEDENMVDNCPHCGHEYDEIDYEYQICHYCKKSAE
jgi:hypothetical protein